LSAGTIENVIDKVPEALERLINIAKKVKTKKPAPEE
jgi:hypothetical protein